MPIVPKKKPEEEKAPNYVKISDFEKYPENPFMQQVVESMTVKTRKKYLRQSDGKAHMMVINNEGDVAAQAQFYEIQEVDDSQFIKVFANFFAVSNGLTKSGREVLNYIMSRLMVSVKKDAVSLRGDQALDYLGYSSLKPFYRGLGDLLAKGVIARSQYTDVFYINPDIMFNGDRITIAKQYVREKSRAAAELRGQLSLFDVAKNPTFGAVQREAKRLELGETEADELARQGQAMNEQFNPSQEAAE